MSPMISDGTRRPAWRAIANSRRHSASGQASITFWTVSRVTYSMRASLACLPALSLANGLAEMSRRSTASAKNCRAFFTCVDTVAAASSPARARRQSAASPGVIRRRSLAAVKNPTSLLRACSRFSFVRRFTSVRLAM
jgi:hypothetical protein